MKTNMEIVVDDLVLNYEILGEGKPLVLLHGWGNSMKSFEGVKSLLSNQFKVVALDLPGFGGSSIPKRPFSLDDYIEVLRKFFDKLEFQKVNLLGHSFGGRIAMKFTYKYPWMVEKLILIGAPFRRSKKGRVGIKLYATKLGKLFFSIPALKKFYKTTRKKLYSFFDEHDYETAGPLRETFGKIISEELLEVASRISKPTLIIWGEKDDVVPVSEGMLLSKIVPESKLEVIRDASHMVHQDKKEEFLEVINNFL